MVVIVKTERKYRDTIGHSGLPSSIIAKTRLTAEQEASAVVRHGYVAIML